MKNLQKCNSHSDILASLLQIVAVTRGEVLIVTITTSVVGTNLAIHNNGLLCKGEI